MATMGANQFENPKNQATFFNWFFFTLYAATVVSITAIVYVKDNVSWRLGFGLCAIANLIGLVIFLCGAHFYRFDKPQGSPFVGLARVVVASARKRNLQQSSGGSKDYYYGHGGVTDDLVGSATPSSSFRRGSGGASIRDIRYGAVKMVVCSSWRTIV
ncbi:protein NRT1/ PTR FAMILY 2.6-like [Prunus yedoensis var. nudiflora]|uniref:Protein NRT1/ PTR FAMILY 2.6-like n=1 Tax=Prunus yedoensis var. nudiflora TaxID=2094558 RepID=A0A314YAM8_PRUYE|nr:protein NRT1/ PTR FAMILY 2.6-like [Prunus yedoensis var. nudiflora]